MVYALVILTANSTIEQQIEWLSTGEGAYVSKPFDINLLDRVLKSLLVNRIKLRNKFLGVEPPENFEKSLPKRDIDFIIDIMQFIEKNISNKDLNVELLSNQFIVSPAAMNRKIGSLTGLSPNNLIKSIWLKKAYKLLSEDGLRISEAAYQTGFSDPNYFTTYIKKNLVYTLYKLGIRE